MASFFYYYRKFAKNGSVFAELWQLFAELGSLFAEMWQLFAEFRIYFAKRQIPTKKEQPAGHPFTQLSKTYTFYNDT